MPARSPLPLALVALTIAVLAGSGCGRSADSAAGGGHPDYAKALAGSPPPLAALHRQANELLSGGTEAYERRITALRGYPVVANVWASWCGPCRFEFPTLQKLAARYGKKVAFVGINYQDSDDAAETFLGEESVPYPSYSDPDKEIAEAVGIHGGIPDTAFYNSAGEIVYLKYGPYSDESELEADVRRYALQGG